MLPGGRPRSLAPSTDDTSLADDIEFKAQDRCLQMCVPGETMGRASAEVNKIIVEGLLELGILKGTVTELLDRRIYSTFMPHGLGHSVGLDVHDPGSINPFKPGMVVTCEPGICESRLCVCPPVCYLYL